MDEPQPTIVIPPLSLKALLVRTMGIFLSPRRTLEKVIFERGAFFPLLLIALALAALRLILLPEVLAGLDSPQFLETWSEQRAVSPEKAIEEIGAIKKMAPLFTMVESPFLVITGVVVISFIIMMIGRILFQTPIPLRLVFRVISWASVVSALPLILTALLKLANPAWELPSNLAFFIRAEVTGEYFNLILKSLDIFLIWEIWLISIAVCVLYKISTQRAITTIGTMFLIVIITNVLLSAMKI